jgi:hypothetical protein
MTASGARSRGDGDERGGGVVRQQVPAREALPFVERLQDQLFAPMPRSARTRPSSAARSRSSMVRTSSSR